MKYKLTFKLPHTIVLPQQYNHLLQAALMNWLNDENYQKFIHEVGFQLDKRSYKLYTFSKIFGRFELDKLRHKILFQDEIHIYIASYDSQYIEFLLSNIISGNPIRLGNQCLYLERAEAIQEAYTSPCVVKTLSPIIIYSTLMKLDGTHKQYYYSPMECEYSQMLGDNLVRKFAAYHGRRPEDTAFSIRLLDQGRESFIFYKKASMKGWNGIFRMEGSEEMICMALDGGLGSRNSAGFGCVMRIQQAEKR